jgi:hypothetical protein
MAAGLGFKTFTTGEVLTAADTNGYLMQGILVFADAAARTAAVTSPQEGQTSYLKDTDVIQVYSGTAWVTKSGKVLQVVSTAKTDTFVTSSTSYTDVTGVSVSITPSSATSKIYVMCTINATSANGQLGFFQLMRDSTAIGIGDTAGNRTRASFSSNLGLSLQQGTNCLGINFLDSPATTSATTYKLQVRSTSGNICINRSGDDGDFNYYARTISSITVMEIGA